MNKVMDRATAEHFYRWLETVHVADQHKVEQQIHVLLRDHPQMIETHSWPEMRAICENTEANRTAMWVFEHGYHWADKGR
jgi:hypothetical protein